MHVIYFLRSISMKKKTVFISWNRAEKISQSLEEGIWMNLNWKSEISHVANKAAKSVGIIFNPFAPEPLLTVRADPRPPVSTACDVISFNGQGHLCPLTCAEWRDLSNQHANWNLGPLPHPPPTPASQLNYLRFEVKGSCVVQNGGKHRIFTDSSRNSVKEIPTLTTLFRVKATLSVRPKS